MFIGCAGSFMGIEKPKIVIILGRTAVANDLSLVWPRPSAA
jgi:hypothetical protein